MHNSELVTTEHVCSQKVNFGHVRRVHQFLASINPIKYSALTNTIDSDYYMGSNTDSFGVIIRQADDHTCSLNFCHYKLMPASA